MTVNKTPAEPITLIDQIEATYAEIDDILGQLEVQSRALAGTTEADNISREDIADAQRGTAAVLRILRVELKTMRDAANALYEHTKADKP